MLKFCIMPTEDQFFTFRALGHEEYKKILNATMLTDLDERANLHAFYRSEIYDLDNQITCIIHEAFPQYELEDIADLSDSIITGGINGLSVQASVGSPLPPSTSHRKKRLMNLLSMRRSGVSEENAT